MNMIGVDQNLLQLKWSCIFHFPDAPLQKIVILNINEKPSRAEHMLKL